MLSHAHVPTLEEQIVIYDNLCNIYKSSPTKKINEAVINQIVEMNGVLKEIFLDNETLFLPGDVIVYPGMPFSFLNNPEVRIFQNRFFAENGVMLKSGYQKLGKPYISRASTSGGSLGTLYDIAISMQFNIFQTGNVNCVEVANNLFLKKSQDIKQRTVAWRVYHDPSRQQGNYVSFMGNVIEIPGIE